MSQITLKAARVNSKLTQAKAAELLGISESTLLNWEKGVSYPNAIQIQRIEEVYNVKYDFIFFGKESRFNRNKS